MPMNNTYAREEPTRADVDALNAPTMIEFGSPSCPYCISAQPLIAAAFADHEEVQHIKIRDGKGQPLGRSYRITLWPTLVFLDQGKEVARLVRPAGSAPIREALAAIDRPA